MPQYKVVELREGVIGGKMSGDKREKVLNEHRAKGWSFKSITSGERPRWPGWRRRHPRFLREAVAVPSCPAWIARRDV